MAHMLQDHFKSLLSFVLICSIFVQLFANQTLKPNALVNQNISPDVTIVGYTKFSNGLGRNTIAALDYLSDTLTMNFIQTRPHIFSFEDMPLHVKAIIEKNNPTPGKVAILYDTLDDDHAAQIPNCRIKLAYSMIEATEILPEWTSIINNDFDAVVVPDHFLVEVYQNSGVQKPIFVLPHPIYIDRLLAKPLKTETPKDKFIFGVSCAFTPNKNYETIINAFIQEFKNSKQVELRIHGPEETGHLKQVKKRLASKKVKNIVITAQAIPWAHYIEFMSSLDCYCLVSKGEGFSVTSREALALGIPTIISNNTAHKTVCNSGYVYAVPSEILEPHVNRNRTFGKNFNCKIEDVRKALREVYENYQIYLAKAHQGREWVKQYHGTLLKPKYLNLFKPTKVILGPENVVTDEYLMTNDTALYEKYVSMTKGNQ